jgi:hypothetical protein
VRLEKGQAWFPKERKKCKLGFANYTMLEIMNKFGPGTKLVMLLLVACRKHGWKREIGDNLFYDPIISANVVLPFVSAS